MQNKAKQDVSNTFIIITLYIVLPQYSFDTDFSKEAYTGNLVKIASELIVLEPI